jgi:integrase
MSEKTDVGPRPVLDTASKARNRRHRARIGKRPGSGSAGMSEPHTAAPGADVGRRGAVGGRPKGKRGLRFRDLAELALEEKRKSGIRNSSLRADRVRLSVLNPVIGSLRISSFKARTFAHALADIAEQRQLSHGSFNRYHSLVSSVCAYGVREELLEVNPLAAGRVRRRSEARIHVRFLERHEQSQVLAQIKREHPPKTDELELAILTGMRRGEQFNATWANWKKRESVLLVDGKTGPREVRINRAAGRCLARMRRRVRAGQLYITPERNASPMDRRRWFERAVKKAGLASKFRWHDCRHTFCSRLVAAGVPLLEVQQLAGHASFQTTLRYAHLSPDHRRKAVEKVRF